MVDLDLDKLELAEEMCCLRTPPNGCSDKFTQLPDIITRENNLQFPHIAEEATILYVTLLEEIEKV